MGSESRKFEKTSQITCVAYFPALQSGLRFAICSHSRASDSQAEAVTLGGNLASISDQAENDWVISTFNGDINQRLLWLGLTDQSQEGIFEWVSGEPLVYTAWDSGEPNNELGEDYVVAPWVDGNTWNDVNNDASAGGTSIFGVVEVTVPEPSSALLISSLAIFGLAGGRRQRIRAQRYKEGKRVPRVASCLRSRFAGETSGPGSLVQGRSLE